MDKGQYKHKNKMLSEEKKKKKMEAKTAPTPKKGSLAEMKAAPKKKPKDYMPKAKHVAPMAQSMVDLIKAAHRAVRGTQ